VATEQNAPIFNGSGTSTIPVSASGDLRIDGLLSGLKWALALITYSDPDAAADYQVGYFSDVDADGFSAQSEGFSQLSITQRVAVHFALDATTFTQPPGAADFSVEGFTQLDLNYTGAGESTGTIRVANTSDTSTAYGFLPDSGIFGGDVWVGPSAATPIAGNFPWYAMLHELGHALGLSDGHDADGFGALPADVDSMEYSVMTNRSYIGDPVAVTFDNEAAGYAQSFMMLDIAALQYVYGADYTVNSGNTVYTWSPGSGETFVNGSLAIDPADNRIFATIWDGNGIDTYDLSNYTNNVSIDLRPGGQSLFAAGQLAYLGGGPNGGYARGNVFNALLFDGDTRSLIENAIGGSGADRLQGNQAANALTGNDGNDTLIGAGGNDNLFGGAGDDTLYGDSNAGPVTSGNDFLDGGLGVDTMIGGAGDDTYVVAQLDASLAPEPVIELTGEGTDTVRSAFDYTLPANVENLVLTGSALNANGNALANVLTGTGSANVLNGGAGADTLRGVAGNDALNGGAGGDALDGGTGVDFATYEHAAAGVLASLAFPAANTGEAAGDTYASVEGIIGSDFRDTLVGDGGSNTLRGGDGNDYLQGAGGLDTLEGGSGSDQLEGSASPDGLDGGVGLDYAAYHYAAAAVTVDLAAPASNTGDAAGDIFTAIEGVIGSAHADTLLGDGAANQLLGAGGSDALFGRTGNDVLFGMDGNDTLDGGAGADQLRGDAGMDSASYATSMIGVVVNLGSWSQNTGDAVGDTYLSIEGLVGSNLNDVLVGDNAANGLSGLAGNDYLQGRNGTDLLQGGDGSDRLEGGAGADQLQGGAGSDFAAYYYAAAGVTADLLSSGANAGDAAGDSYLAIEGLIGSFNGDLLNGDNAANGLLGLTGNDTLRGRGGADTLDGGANSDTLEGGADNDVFRFVAGQASGDIVVDFQGNGAGAGDALIFQGFGAGATFVQVNATQWNINHGGGTESIAFANSAAIHASDYTFL